MTISVKYNYMTWRVDCRYMTFKNLKERIGHPSSIISNLCDDASQWFETELLGYGVVGVAHVGSGIIQTMYDSHIMKDMQPFVDELIRKDSLTYFTTIGNLEIAVSIGIDADKPHYCGDEDCDEDCGILWCGCIDVCRRNH
jgi:hypothetical protein